MSDDQLSATSDSQERHGASKPRRWRPQFGLRWMFWLALLVALYVPMLQLPYDAMWLLVLWSLGTVTVSTVLMKVTRGVVLPGAIVGAVLIILPFIPYIGATIDTTLDQQQASTDVFSFIVFLGSQGFGVGGGIHAIIKGYRRVGYATVIVMLLSLFLLSLLSRM